MTEEPRVTEEPRETGVAVETCPTCSGSVQQRELADGSVSGEPCQTCYPGTTPVVAELASGEEQSVPREQGTTVVITDPKE